MSRQSHDDGLNLVRGTAYGLMLEADFLLLWFVVLRAINLLRAWGVL